MFKTYFNPIQVTLLVFAGICFIISLVFQFKDREKISVAFLILTALFLFCFAALLDPFLNIWDERFHALVAKNLMKHPFMPTLYNDPVVNMAYDRWDRYHIWLHKQPLFLWQIMVCFKLFGVNEFALRIPSVILGVILVFISYRSGKLLVNKTVGYYTAVLVLSCNYSLELIAGRLAVDHNDFTFFVYISLSIWSFLEYHYSKKKTWIYLTGLFSGFAIVCKWLVGLLIYWGWFILKLQEKKWKVKDSLDWIIALGITLLIALPWQIFTFIKYPAEAMLAYQYNVLHFLYPLDGHEGTCWFYLNEFKDFFGNPAPFLVIPAFMVLHKKINDRRIFVSLVSMVVIVYLFFTLTATKMPSFTIVVAMIIFIAFAALLESFITFIYQLKLPGFAQSGISFMAILIFIFLRFDVELLQEKHTLWKTGNMYSRTLMHNREVFKSLVLPENTVLFNVKGRHYIEAMFYTGFPSYNFIPTKEQYYDMKGKMKTIAIFKPANNDLPDYLQNDSSTIVINKNLEFDE